jgi:bacterioferritin-associated ferredoxin
MKVSLATLGPVVEGSRTDMFVCSCFGITEEQVKQHAEDGRRTPRAIAGACRAGTDCGSCVKRIQALLGRTAATGSVAAPAAARPVPVPDVPAAPPVPMPAAVPAPCPVHPFPRPGIAPAA